MKEKAGIELTEINTRVHPLVPGKNWHKIYIYDIVAWNLETDTLVVVKELYNLDESSLNNFLEKLSKFRMVFPHLKDSTIYGAIAAFKMEESAYKEAQRKGLFVIQGISAKMHFEADFEPKNIP